MTTLSENNPQGTAIVADGCVLAPVVLEAIQNDAQIKALNQRLNDLYKYSTPKYVMLTNGEIIAANTKEFDEALAKIVEQIELRQQQIMSGYDLR